MKKQHENTAYRNLQRRRKGITELHEFEFICKDGSEVVCQLHTNPIYDHSKNYCGAMACVSDITQRKKYEENYIRMKNIKALEIMARCFAHDFANFINIISNNIALFLEENNSNLENRDFLVDALNVSQSATSLVCV